MSRKKKAGILYTRFYATTHTIQHFEFKAHGSFHYKGIHTHYSTLLQHNGEEQKIRKNKTWRP